MSLDSPRDTIDTAVRRASHAQADLTWDSVKVTAVREASVQPDSGRRSLVPTESGFVPLPGAREGEGPADGARRATPRPSGPLASADGDSVGRARSDQTPSGLSLVPPPRAARSPWKRRMVLTLVFLVFLATGLAATVVVSTLVR
jgi:hypothetical protein